MVGATGALRPAAERLVRDGADVTGLARHVDLPGGRTLEVDFTDVDALRTALHGRRFDAALLYCPTAPAAAVELFVQAADGRVVELLTSAVAAPPFEPADLPPSDSVRVVLGWAPGPRWHTADELSGAALDALHTGRDAVLGTVRPWSDRPS